MRIAVFTPYPPYPPDTGGKIRSYHLLQALARRFEVDLYTVYYGDSPSEATVDTLRKHCREVILLRLQKSRWAWARVRSVLAPLPRTAQHFHTPNSLRETRNHLQHGNYDLLVADELCMTPYVELAPELPKVIARQKVDHAHYLEMARSRPLGSEKLLDLLEAFKLRRYSRLKMPLYQASVVCSQRDAALIRRDSPHVPALVIPNGADLSKFVPGKRSAVSTPTLLYVGSMDYYPNIDAMRFFFDDVYGSIRRVRPDVRAQVVGHSPPPEIQSFAELPGVEVTGRVSDVVPYYDRAAVFVVPLRLGGGTRLKIIEAMAMEVPVVSTAVGAEGLDVTPGEDILLADEPRDFARKVLDLLSDEDLYARIASGGRRLAERYDWRELTKPYGDLARKVAEDCD
ncbi:MAG: glycosyltransferase [Anaerolineae bacterium]